MGNFHRFNYLKSFGIIPQALNPNNVPPRCAILSFAKLAGIGV